MTLDEYIGRQIARVRGDAGMSVKTLADKLGITEAKLIAYEAGQETAPASHISELGFIFKVSYLEFFPSKETIPQVPELDQDVRQDIGPLKDTKH